MFTIKKILVPVDFSECSSNALQYAKEMAESMKSTLYLLHVIEPVVYPVDWGYSQVGFADIEREITETARKEMTSLEASLVNQGFAVQTAIVPGRAAEIIIEYAAEENVDIISIGTHGRGGIEKFLFGSTTEKVLQKAPCPVLCVRKKEQQS